MTQLFEKHLTTMEDVATDQVSLLLLNLVYKERIKMQYLAKTKVSQA